MSEVQKILKTTLYANNLLKNTKKSQPFLCKFLPKFTSNYSKFAFTFTAGNPIGSTLGPWKDVNLIF